MLDTMNVLTITNSWPVAAAYYTDVRAKWQASQYVGGFDALAFEVAKAKHVFEKFGYVGQAAVAQVLGDGKRRNKRRGKGWGAGNQPQHSVNSPHPQQQQQRQQQQQPRQQQQQQFSPTKNHGQPG